MHPIHHHNSINASRAMERWRFLASQGLAYSTAKKPKSLDEVERFTAAYRRGATELARVRAFSPDKQLADYIEQAVATSHFAVHRRKRPKLTDAIVALLFGFPALVRKYWRYHAISIGISIGAALIAFIAVWVQPQTYYLFVDGDLAGGRNPAADTAYLASTLGPQDTELDEDAFFSTFLFTHNTRVAFMAFAFGIALGLPTIYILIVNGLMLGAFTSLFVQRGLAVEYFAWILPHGVPELGAIFLCGGAGLALGHRVLNPGDRARGPALRKAAADASLTALGCVPLLLIAGIVEGSFRQSYAPIWMRYALMLLLLMGLLSWILFTRRRVAAA